MAKRRRLRRFRHLCEILRPGVSSAGTLRDDAAHPSINQRRKPAAAAGDAGEPRHIWENTGKIDARARAGLTVSRVRGLAPTDFCLQYVDQGRPVVLVDAAADWPALRTWDPEYLARRVGNRAVDVAIGVEEVSEPTVKASVSLLDLAAQISGREADSQGEAYSHCEGIGDTAPFRRPLYLKQANLFKMVPSLRDDVFMTELLGTRRLCSTTHYCWVGQCGAVTGLHNDDEDNLLAQLRGRKRVLLYEPQQRPNLYVNDKYDSGTECCDVDPASPDYMRHPLLRAAQPPFEVTLSPGDVLFLPKFWFHHATSLGTTVSVNLFFSTPRDFLRHGLLRTGKEVLHAVGLIGRGNCVCHPADSTR